MEVFFSIETEKIRIFPSILLTLLLTRKKTRLFLKQEGNVTFLSAYIVSSPSWPQHNSH